MIIILVIALYRFFSKKVDNIEKLYKSFDNILNEETQNIELPNEMTRFSEKLNKIKYEYILSTKRAKEAEQKKNDLIMYMAHDLKTPLTSVIGYLSLLNEEQEISKKLQNKYIKIALDKALRVEELTNQFFEITRYNLNDIPLNKTNIDLVMLLDQLVEEFYPMLEERNLKLNITKPNTKITTPAQKYKFPSLPRLTPIPLLVPVTSTTPMENQAGDITPRIAIHIRAIKVRNPRFEKVHIEKPSFFIFLFPM